jgi:hypothetical protein
MIGAAPASAGDRTGVSCRAYAYRLNGVGWRATGIHVSNVGCGDARSLIKSYSHPRNCRFARLCRVGKWNCKTTQASGSTYGEACTSGRRRVSWRGSYLSQ